MPYRFLVLALPSPGTRAETLGVAAWSALLVRLVYPIICGVSAVKQLLQVTIMSYILLAQTLSITTIVTWTLLALLAMVGLGFAIAVFAFGTLWIQASAASARVSMASLIGMYFRQVRAPIIVNTKIMAAQAGLDISSRNGITTQRLEAHYLAGGNVMSVIQAIIAAQRADIDLDFDRAAAIDLAGRDVLDAVRTSVNPKVIDCPIHVAVAKLR